MIGTRVAAILDEHGTRYLGRVVTVEDGICTYEFDKPGILPGQIMAVHLAADTASSRPRKCDPQIRVIERASFTYRPGDRKETT